MDREALISPLSKATGQLLKPIQLSPCDRLSIGISHTGNAFDMQAYGICDNGERGYPSTAAGNTFFGLLPERKQVVGHYGRWLCASTDITSVLTFYHWPQQAICFASDAARDYMTYLALRFMRQHDLAKMRADFKVHGIIPRLDYVDSKELPLAPYQRVALASALNSEMFALFMEQGTGKTPVVIARICNEALKATKRYMAIVVCPKNVRANWLNELSRFSTVPGIAIVLRGDHLVRIKQLIEVTAPDPALRWSCVVVSYETMLREWASLGAIEWDLAVLDESHFIKSHNTKRFRGALKLRDRARQRMCLTGTPIANTPFDLFAQFEFLGRGFSGFSSFAAFKSYYGKYVQQGDRNVLVDFRNVPILQERLNRAAIMTSKLEALPNLPDKVYDIIEVTMTKEQADAYDALRDKLVLEIEQYVKEAQAQELVVTNVLTQLLRLAQITSGFIGYSVVDETDDGSEGKTHSCADRFDPNPKLDALTELLKSQSSKSKALIWACWVQDIKSISARLELEGYERGRDFVTYYGSTSDDKRDEAVKKFNCDPRCRWFIGNASTGGTGINARGYDPDDPDSDTNCDLIVYYSQNWSQVTRTQSEDRAHRRGTRVQVRVVDLCVPGTVDEEIRARVTAKKIMAMSLQDVGKLMQRLASAEAALNGD